ncbi:MAG: hypothetical protein COZ37_07305 [bacterium (Candidatus Ratteibacteria) CG_4_10_14_3_um_filter_41_18]|uniref:UDP-N-acetylglucosamine--N-acetylmuramyl-(pentapeptide) pyrophosphoryl-undecaprenol N-acetylglucosamine transferase n=3 Tax=Candidatus Ratteibacteria TaxID=2979319 RepID=A0A2M7YF44_9BACT|nr:MAG: hypothetical protein AUJ76_04090 [Candidatus Omnitrophica bacterium CG1_02_41_171]PIW74513.1 MAG: hypothetical protein CO004_00300 [bacterium (Candidatus Ratteibacteria) CG_4_8_14_3_um_filter_41_36]PIX76548.1 MAG: hypothetical protein COZ37_07305 [bacterium (Candidatus Ratteibacteria) CG_4_10_14_3_um_filter_41_18]PJA61607.1 MAG: hypothetical protein CO162_05415 [bacterium (Candidatus Ratteibacteria) CG_4_9_14_3_um_filter_41_21]HCG76492.1 hypothetical protein [bacterium]
MKCIVIAAGGTGGHLFPALAIAEELKEKNKGLKIVLVGRAKKKYQHLFRKKGFVFWEMRAIRLPEMSLWKAIANMLSLRAPHPCFRKKAGGRGNLEIASSAKERWRTRNDFVDWLKFPFLLFPAFMQTIFMLLRFKPAVVVGMGGAASGLPVLAASFLRIRTLIQEHDILPGVTTKILSHFAGEIAVGFEETKKYLPGKNLLVTGNPVKKQILERNREDALKELGLPPGYFTILFLGGSGGAHSLNLTAAAAIDDLENEEENLQIIHLTGETDYPRIKRIYQKSSIKSVVLPFTEKVENVYAAADLVIARAGAMTISEISARGLPAILIPYPYAKRNHQEINAKYLVEKEAAILIKDQELSGPRLAREILSLRKDRKRLSEMSKNSQVLARPKATEKTVEGILKLMKTTKDTSYKTTNLSNFTN